MTSEDIGSWPRWDSPASAGWDEAKLAEARAFAETLDTAAVMIVCGGRVVDAWGTVATRYNIHSVRKSLLSALIGIHEAEGRIPLGATLGQLNIDDHEGLMDREKLAVVLDLLTARSGVYHPSNYESPWMVAVKPARGSAGPGMAWCYNNWDFNALGTIFQQLTKANIFQDFGERIAEPCGMEDFRPEQDGEFVTESASEHPAYPFRMTARDLARFGELYLRKGRLNGRQIVPSDWVEASVLPYSDAGVLGAYGYMWWVSRAGILFPGTIVPPRTYLAAGAGGHFVVVLPAIDAVVVHRVDTDEPGKNVPFASFGQLLRRILLSAPSG